MDDFFRFSKKIGFLGILGPPYCGIGATIRIGREMLCLPYAGFFKTKTKSRNTSDTSHLYHAIQVQGTVKLLYKIQNVMFFLSQFYFSFANYEMCMEIGKYPLEGIYVLDIGENLMAHLDSLRV